MTSSRPSKSKLVTSSIDSTLLIVDSATHRRRTPDRLRQKVRVPYQSLQLHVTRLQRIHQAHDALRRMARFSVLQKRLESQMSGLAPHDENDGTGSLDPARPDAHRSVDHEEEKERVIAKAALAVAELGVSSYRVVCVAHARAEQMRCSKGLATLTRSRCRYPMGPFRFLSVLSMPSPHTSLS